MTYQENLNTIKAYLTILEPVLLRFEDSTDSISIPCTYINSEKIEEEVDCFILNKLLSTFVPSISKLWCSHTEFNTILIQKQ